MRTLRSYLAREVAVSTSLVFLALLLLFAFFDLVEQMKDLGRGGYQLRHILLHVLLLTLLLLLRGPLDGYDLERSGGERKPLVRTHPLQGMSCKGPHFQQV